MAKPKISIHSSKGTPESEVIYVIETPSVERIKFRKQDIEKEIVYIDDQSGKMAKRKTELQDILAEVNKL